MNTSASHSPNSFAEAGVDADRVYVAPNRGEVAHLDAECWILDGIDGDPEAIDPVDAPEATCRDCEIRAALRAALAAHHRGGDGT